MLSKEAPEDGTQFELEARSGATWTPLISVQCGVELAKMDAVRGRQHGVRVLKIMAAAVTRGEAVCEREAHAARVRGTRGHRIQQKVRVRIAELANCWQATH